MLLRGRRSFLKSGAAAMVGTSILRAPGLVADVRPRVGIIGGGLAGVSCAWLLDGVADAVLFESRTDLGTLRVDSQETALFSAMNVVRALEPQAPNLLALES
jgi:predicted NAD/FAD-binding protein